MSRSTMLSARSSAAAAPAPSVAPGHEAENTLAAAMRPPRSVTSLADSSTTAIGWPSVDLDAELADVGDQRPVRRQPVGGPADRAQPAAILERLDDAGLQQVRQAVGPLAVVGVGHLARTRRHRDLLGVQHLQRGRRRHHQKAARSRRRHPDVARRGEVEGRLGRAAAARQRENGRAQHQRRTDRRRALTPACAITKLPHACRPSHHHRR